jgi:hypothetical protein
MENPIDYYNDVIGANAQTANIYTRDDIILPDENWELINSALLDWEDIKKKFDIDEYGNQPIIICKKTTYTQAHRKAQQKYREKFPEKYNEVQRKLYDDKKKDDEWKKKFNERSKLNNKKYREKKLQERIESGLELKPKGRPRKFKPEIIDVKIDNLVLEGQNPDKIDEPKVEEKVEIVLEEPKKKRTYKKKEKNIEIIL